MNRRGFIRSALIAVALTTGLARASLSLDYAPEVIQPKIAVAQSAMRVFAKVDGVFMPINGVTSFSRESADHSGVFSMAGSFKHRCVAQQHLKDAIESDRSVKLMIDTGNSCAEFSAKPLDFIIAADANLPLQFESRMRCISTVQWNEF